MRSLNRSHRRILLAAIALGSVPASAQPLDRAPDSAEPAVRLGDPYVIDGRDFRPTDAPLDEVGYAGVMPVPGDSLAGGAIAAAHRTLPIPSYAEVTVLATGRTILVRVSERGPFVTDRVIDLSCGAVQQLGLSALPAAIRVRRVNPPDQERGALRAGRPAAERMEAPAGLLSALRGKLPLTEPHPVDAGDCALAPAAGPPPVVAEPAPRPARPPRAALPPKPIPPKLAASPTSPTPAPAPVAAADPKGPGYAIQVAALSSRAKAASLARAVGGHVEAAGTIFRVRKGPYATESAARAAPAANPREGLCRCPRGY